MNLMSELVSLLSNSSPRKIRVNDSFLRHHRVSADIYVEKNAGNG